MKISARNQLKGKVAAVTPGATTSHVSIDIGGGNTVMASITRKVEPHIHSVFGGFHLVDLSDDEVTAMVTRLRDKWQIERMAWAVSGRTRRTDGC
jgi:molybdopterin-binding protein